MVKRSLRASTTGIERAKKAFQRKGWTQEYLAGEVGLETRHSIWKFFKGKPIERYIFVDICLNLDLDWHEIADLDSEAMPTAVVAPPASPPSPNLDIDQILQQARLQLSEPILAQCSTLRLLDTAQPMGLDELYINVTILEQLSRQQWLDLSDLQADAATMNRVAFNRESQLGISGNDAIATYPKLVVMGKPGAGKTTFLQKIALQCLRDELPLTRIPLFIRLRNLAEEIIATPESHFNVVDSLTEKLGNFGIAAEHVELLCKQGKVLFLLDGLDEVPAESADTILKQIAQLTETYYQNQFIITCRFAAQSYRFPGFTYVELADFNQEQIEAFAKKWFICATQNPNREDRLELAAQFIEKLKLPENQPIRELAKTPILLNLAVSVFQAKADFPNKRSKLYEAGLDILLVRWDEARGIHRDEVYRRLSLPHKIKLLCHLAAMTFEQGNYFFERGEIEQHIADYLTTLPGTNSDPETLRLNSEAVVQAIEAQHGLLVERARGIYSFSHLTFQEYFTARNIAASPDEPTLLKALQQLSQHVTQPQWREVFVLTTELLRNAEPLLRLMKQQIDGAIATEMQLQAFLRQIEEKCRSLPSPYKPAAVRAFYFTLFLDRDLGLAIALDRNLARDLAPELVLDLALTRAFSLVQRLTDAPEIEQILALGFALNLEGYLAEKSELESALQQLKEQLPDLGKGKDYLLQWWREQGRDWAASFRSLLREHRQIGEEWQWSEAQLIQLKQYYQANQLFVDCLNSDCRCDAAARSELEGMVLLSGVQEL